MSATTFKSVLGQTSSTTCKCARDKIFRGRAYNFEVAAHLTPRTIVRMEEALKCSSTSGPAKRQTTGVPASQMRKSGAEYRSRGFSNIQTPRGSAKPYRQRHRPAVLDRRVSLEEATAMTDQCGVQAKTFDFRRRLFMYRSLFYSDIFKYLAISAGTGSGLRDSLDFFRGIIGISFFVTTVDGRHIGRFVGHGPVLRRAANREFSSSFPSANGVSGVP